MGVVTSVVELTVPQNVGCVGCFLPIEANVWKKTVSIWVDIK